MPINDPRVLEALQKFGSKFPVPVIALAESLGIKVLENSDFEDTLSGSISKEGDQFSIHVNATHAPTRKRFTIAHEIGHFILHRELLDSGSGEHVDPVKRPLVLNRSKNSNSAKKIESEADNFAGEVLMPEEEFKKIWTRSNTVEEVATYFGVSESAATVRASILLKSAIF